MKREHFGSRWAVIFAMAGSAIGLGNIWRFPYMMGEHGGAAFIIIYILASVLVSLPVFIAEVTLGRRSRRGSFGAMAKLKPDKKIWVWAGWLSIGIPLLINSYYSVIGGWSLDFLYKACTGAFVKSGSDVTGLFDIFISHSWQPVVFHLLFMGACCFVVLFGVKSGIEKFSKFSIPVLFLLILAMIIYSVTLPGAGEGVKYLSTPDFSQADSKTFVYALGQSFYSLSLGMGAIVTYGSYVHKDEDIVASSSGTAIFDLAFAIMAGFAIMPAVFAAGLQPGAGPGLIFQSIPYIFSSMAAEAPVLSVIISIVFFFTVVIAAMTSCISLVEVGTGFLMERYGISRRRAVFYVFLMCGGLGVFCALSFGPLKNIQLVGKNLFDLFDWFSSNILLLTLAFLNVLFVGFVLKKEDVKDEITNGGSKKRNEKLFPVIYFCIKWIAPIAIATIFITNFIL